MAGPRLWEISPFNRVFWIATLTFAGLLVVATVILRRKSEKTRRTAVVVASMLTLLGFFVYKYFLSIDSEYDLVADHIGGFNWWGELPLHLCNINMILMPIAVITDRRALKSMCFFVGPLGASMSILMPVAGFSGFSIFLPRMLGYYGTHYMIIIEGLSLVTLGLYKPKYRDIPPTLISVIATSFAAFLISMGLRISGLNDHANYFMSVSTEGNPVLELFHSFIPYPFLYLLPCAFVLAIYMVVIIAGFNLADKLKERAAARSNIQE